MQKEKFGSCYVGVLEFVQNEKEAATKDVH